MRKALTTAGDYFQGVLQPDYDEHLRDQTDLRRAFHAATSLLHMADWVFITHEGQIKSKFTFKDRKGKTKPVGNASQFANALQQKNADFGRIRGIANAATHLKLDHVSQLANAPTHADNILIRTATTYLPGFLNVVARGRGWPVDTIVLEGENGNDLKFSPIARSVYNMWQELNSAHHWW
jgi:hypothetical protein